MIEKIKEIKNQIDVEVNQIKNLFDLDQFRIKYLSRKGLIAELFEALKKVSSSDKPALGKAVNELRTSTQSIHDEKKSFIEMLDKEFFSFLKTYIEK